MSQETLFDADPKFRKGRPKGKRPGLKYDATKVRFMSIDEKKRIIEFVQKYYPEMSLSGFFRMLAREKIESVTGEKIT